MTPFRQAAVIFALAVLLEFAAVGQARACSLVRYGDDGRYVGRPFLAQIVAEADTIQVVEVVRRYVVSRTYTAGERFLSFGEAETPEGWPDHTDEFAFELSVVETLKGGVPSSRMFYEDVLRVRGFGLEEIRASSPGLGVERHPNALPDWIFDRPANDGYLFGPADQWAGLGGGECNPPYLLDVGQRLVAFRDSMGRLYPADGAFPLELDAVIRSIDGREHDIDITMQSLVPIAGSDDPFLVRLRSALSVP